MGNTFIVELTYRVRREEKDLSKSVSLDSSEALFCDLGIDNFATFVSTKPGVRPFLIKGKDFVMLPHRKFVEMIRYKAEDYGIRVTVREESYTSKASALDFDEMPTFDKKESGAKPVFSGRRIKRGLYRSAKGQLINADINAAANIGRKELGDEWLKKLLELDGGVLVDTPAVVRNLHTSKNIRQWLELGTRSQETAHVSGR